MKKITTFLVLILIITIGIFGCDIKKHQASNIMSIEELEEIDPDLIETVLDSATNKINDSESDSVRFNSETVIYSFLDSQEVHIEYNYFNMIQADEVVNSIPLDNTDESNVNSGLDNNISHADNIREAHLLFENDYSFFEEFCSDNPDCIHMEMQDDRGYIIFDIDDSEIISALSGVDEVSEGTRYYGVRYHCDRCYITATYMSDSNDDFRDFVSLLDELGLPHM